MVNLPAHENGAHLTPHENQFRTKSVTQGTISGQDKCGFRSCDLLLWAPFGQTLEFYTKMKWKGIFWEKKDEI